MTPLALRIAAALAVLMLVAGAVLLWLGADDGLRAAILRPERLATLLALVVVAAWLVSLPVAQLLDRRDAELRRLAARTEELEARLATAARQRQELIGKLSHDLRTPLASMQGYLELLLLRHDSLEPAEARNYLQTAVRQTERLSRLVGDLFELVRLEADTRHVQSEPFPVAELAHDVVQRFAAPAERAQVRLDVRLDARADGARSPIVMAEVALVERVLGNLVENALRHTPCGGCVTIEIEDDGATARLSVADTGAGIPGSELPGVFDRFETASRVGDGSGSAAGLGLAIARRIAALHGSDLELRSQPGVGTRVSFALPLAPRRHAA